MVRNSILFGAVAALGLAGAASASVYSGAGGAIPDNNPAGLLSDIVVGDAFFVGDITITLENLAHTWVGDLIVTVTHLDSGATQSLFARVGATTVGGVGDSSNLGGNYSFNDAFTGDLWAVAASGPSGFVIPSDNYFATGPLSSAQVSLLGVFGGINAQGTWQLKITDNAGADLGSLGGWSIAFEKSPIPAPGVLALLGVAGLAGSRRRRA